MQTSEVFAFVEQSIKNMQVLKKRLQRKCIQMLELEAEQYLTRLHALRKCVGLRIDGPTYI